MLQRRPLAEWTGRDIEKWRERLSRLLVLVSEARGTREAWHVYSQYRDGGIRFGEARKRHERLAAGSETA